MPSLLTPSAEDTIHSQYNIIVIDEPAIAMAPMDEVKTYNFYLPDAAAYLSGRNFAELIELVIQKPEG